MAWAAGGARAALPTRRRRNAQGAGHSARRARVLDAVRCVVPLEQAQALPDRADGDEALARQRNLALLPERLLAVVVRGER